MINKITMVKLSKDCQVGDVAEYDYLVMEEG